MTRPALHDRRFGILRGQCLWYAKAAWANALAVFLALALFAHRYAYFAWDLRSARALQALSVPGLGAVLRAVSFFGHPVVLDLMIAAAVVLFFYLRWPAEVAALVLCAAGSRSINEVLKLLVARPRPSPELIRVVGAFSEKGFPSGHVTAVVCYFGFLSYIAYLKLPPGSVVRRLVHLVAVALIILIAPSRVYLGAHWPSDTIGSYFIGGLWLALSLYVYRRYITDERGERNESDALVIVSYSSDTPPT